MVGQTQPPYIKLHNAAIQSWHQPADLPSNFSKEASTEDTLRQELQEVLRSAHDTRKVVYDSVHQHLPPARWQ